MFIWKFLITKTYEITSCSYALKSWNTLYMTHAVPSRLFQNADTLSKTGAAARSKCANHSGWWSATTHLYPRAVKSRWRSPLIWTVNRQPTRFQELTKFPQCKCKGTSKSTKVWTFGAIHTICVRRKDIKWLKDRQSHYIKNISTSLTER